MIREVDDHADRCTWHDAQGNRCNAPAVAGSAKRAACLEHIHAHRKLTMEPEEYATWREQNEPQ